MSQERIYDQREDLYAATAEASAPVTGYEAVQAEMKRQRDEIAAAYFQKCLEIAEVERIASGLRAAVEKMAAAAEVLRGTTGIGVRNHIRNLAEKALLASKPKPHNNQAEERP